MTLRFSFVRRTIWLCLVVVLCSLPVLAEQAAPSMDQRVAALEHMSRTRILGRA